MSDDQPVHAIGPKRQRWTHLALTVKDLDASIAWYKKHTHFEVLAENDDEFGRGVWLGDSTEAESPFILVLAQFKEGKDPFAPVEHPVLGPFAHIGIEVPTKAEVDAAAELGRQDGSLALGPQQMPRHVGYICFLKDPDGNTIEFSYDQGVYEKAREVWGPALEKA